MATNREIFDKIAGSWYGFRHHTRFRDDLDELAVRWKRGKLLNLGCGHGPDFIPFGGDFELYGMDFSSQMLRQAVKYAIKYGFSAHLALADLLHLPYKNGSFDWAIAVATYHHIQSTDDRQNAFRELHRVVKAGSEVFVTVWNKHQPRFWFAGRETYVPWRTKQQIYERYYYLFTREELSRLVRSAGFEVISARSGWPFRFPLKLFAQNICLLMRAR